MTLSHDDEGSGPAVLLLHSTVGDRRMWDPQVAALTEAGFRAVRCDLPGYGDSPVPVGELDTAALVAALLDERGVGDVALVGSSGGGLVALEVAARWPGRVAGLALLCSASPQLSPGPQLRAFWEREQALLAAGDVPGATELNVATWLGPRAGEQTRALVRRMQRHAFEVQLAAGDPVEAGPAWQPDTITASSLVVAGAHDLDEFRAVARDLAARLPHARHVELDWAAHLPSLEDPPVVNALLLEFLGGLRRRSADPARRWR
ncbi:alpha/beta fold hydrolase [Actinoplanes sp. URMC 104]|uniref:alpha/beta fold hydrolase n=1 Tax=Actinoplanes sp. URMC 104 TaxID=3423409 RepID=UPI003F1A1A37